MNGVGIASLGQPRLGFHFNPTALRRPSDPDIPSTS
jgi:hypothetical protein